MPLHTKLPFSQCIVGVLVAVMACSSPAPQAGMDVSAGSADVSAAPDVVDASIEDVQPDLPDTGPVDPGYPPEPYGPAIGDTLPNLTFQGFYAPDRVTGLSNTETFGTVDFEMLRQAGRNGKQYALIQLGAYW